VLRRHFLLGEVERRVEAISRSRRRSRASFVRQIELERQRLGRELHTGVGQVFAAIKLQSEIVSLGLTEPSAPVQQALDRIESLIQIGLDQTRSLSHRLHPPEWQRLKLEDAIRQLWELSGIPQKLDALSNIETLPEEPDPEIKALVYRTAQEAFSNITRHARAQRAEVTLEARGGRLILTVRDNGAGFDVPALLAAPPNVTSGIGLRSIREQAIALGGDLTVESGADGTVLRLSAPFSADQP
jgi:signal transduction histidine kinase